MSGRALAEAMRAWRQSEPGAGREALWAEASRLAGLGARVFESAPGAACAVEEAICSGSLEALDLMARAAERSGEDFGRGLRETDCSQARAAGGAGRPEALLERSWMRAYGPGGGQAAAAAMIERLVELGADPGGHARARGGPLMTMCYLGLEEAAVALIRAGADPNERDERGDTALHKLLRRKEEASKAWGALVRAGADAGLRNNAGQTPAESADPAQRHWLEALREREALMESAGLGRGASPGPRI